MSSNRAIHQAQAALNAAAERWGIEVPSFRSGVRSVFTFGSSPTPRIREPNCDREAMASDWRAVGDDIRSAARSCDDRKSWR